MAVYPSTLADLQGLISNLVNDPANTRYSLTEINQFLDTVQDRWNYEANICKTAQTLTTVGGTSAYALSTLTGNALKIFRVAHKGIALTQRSKAYFDQYTAYDWTGDTGTPKDFCVDMTLTSPSIILRPNPTTNDAGANLLVEYLVRHTQMVNPTDTPFNINGTANTLIQPYVYGIGLEVAAEILEPDPTKETVMKATTFRKQAERVLSNVIQIYTDFDAELPFRMRGGRNWTAGSGGASSPFSS